MNIQIFKKLGFSDKNAQVYLALLRLGPSSVRHLAEAVELNRGTTYDALKWLQEHELVSFYKLKTKQTFVAEPPAKLQELLQEREKELKRTEEELEKLVPELTALHNSGGERPVARYLSAKELPALLQEVIDICSSSDKKEYRIYSTAGIRQYLYEDFPSFSEVRVAKKIGVRAIAIGAGGELRGMDERRFLTASVAAPTYKLIYPGHVASISLDAKGKPVAVVIENEGIEETEKIIFDTLWEHLN